MQRLHPASQRTSGALGRHKEEGKVRRRAFRGIEAAKLGVDDLGDDGREGAVHPSGSRYDVEWTVPILRPLPCLQRPARAPSQPGCLSTRVQLYLGHRGHGAGCGRIGDGAACRRRNGRLKSPA